MKLKTKSKSTAIGISVISVLLLQACGTPINYEIDFGVIAPQSELGTVTIKNNLVSGNKYEKGTEIYLTAAPNDGYEFDCWYYDIDGTHKYETVFGYGPEIGFPLEQDISYYASFKALPPRVTTIVLEYANNSNATMGTLEGAGVYNIPKGENDFIDVTISAIPNTGYTFVGWHPSAEIVGAPLTTNPWTFSAGLYSTYNYYAEFRVL
jgi:hypothetical protein